MTSFVWSIILSLMQGKFDSAREGGDANATQQSKHSAHYAAMQVPSEESDRTYHDEVRKSPGRRAAAARPA